MKEEIQPVFYFDNHSVGLRYLPELFMVLFEIVVIQMKEIIAWFSTTDKQNIEGEIVLVTGAAGTLGKQLCKLFLRRGCQVVLVDVDDGRLDLAMMELASEGDGNRLSCFTCDLSNLNDLRTMCDHVKQEIGHPNILVNSAAVVGAGNILDVSDEQIMKTFHVNTFAPVQLIREFLPNMISKNNGRIITVISIVSKDSFIGAPVYCASKFALEGFISSVRKEIAASGNDGIKFTSAYPYIINTPLFNGIKMRFQNMPFCNILEPDYVAEKIVDSMDRGRAMVYLPRSMYFLITFISVLPVKATDLLHKFMGSNEAMSHFQGRNGNPKTNKKKK